MDKVNIHAASNSHGVQGMQSGDDDAAHSRGKWKWSGSTRQMSQAQSANAVAGPSHSEQQRRPTKRPDADVATQAQRDAKSDMFVVLVAMILNGNVEYLGLLSLHGI